MAGFGVHRSRLLLLHAPCYLKTFLLAKQPILCAGVVETRTRARNTRLPLDVGAVDATILSTESDHGEHCRPESVESPAPRANVVEVAVKSAGTTKVVTLSA